MSLVSFVLSQIAWTHSSGSTDAEYCDIQWPMRITNTRLWMMYLKPKRIIGFTQKELGGNITESEWHYLKEMTLVGRESVLILYSFRPGPTNPYFGHAMERAWPTIFGCTDPNISNTCGGENYNITGCQCCEWSEQF